jgi:hypothetical protein
MPGERADGEHPCSATVRGGAAMSPPHSSVYIVDCPKDSSR